MSFKQLRSNKLSMCYAQSYSIHDLCHPKAPSETISFLSLLLEIIPQSQSHPWPEGKSEELRITVLPCWDFYQFPGPSALCCPLPVLLLGLWVPLFRTSQCYVEFHLDVCFYQHALSNNSAFTEHLLCAGIVTA